MVNSKNNGQTKNGNTSNNHIITKPRLTYGQIWADKLTIAVGSWYFIISLFVVMFIWILLNVFLITTNKWDPYPFILLNFVLSCLAAVQAPIILMSQNREAEKDRIRADYDYSVNRKAEREIQNIQKDLEYIKRKLQKK